MPARSPKPISQVELELTPSVAPYSFTSSPKSRVAEWFNSGVKKPFCPAKPQHAKDFILNTSSVHARAISSIYFSLPAFLILHCLCTITRSLHFTISNLGTICVYKNSDTSRIVTDLMCLNA